MFIWRISSLGIWRITCLEPGGRHTFNTACEIVDALEKAHALGLAQARREVSGWREFLGAPPQGAVEHRNVHVGQEVGAELPDDDVAYLRDIYRAQE